MQRAITAERYSRYIGATVPAIVDRGEVVVAVSTGGASPTLATLLRAQIEALLPERIGALAKLASTFRAQANALIHSSSERRAFWNSAGANLLFVVVVIGVVTVQAP